MALPNQSDPVVAREQDTSGWRERIGYGVILAATAALIAGVQHPVAPRTEFGSHELIVKSENCSHINNRYADVFPTRYGGGASFQFGGHEFQIRTADNRSFINQRDSRLDPSHETKQRRVQALPQPQWEPESSSRIVGKQPFGASPAGDTTTVQRLWTVPPPEPQMPSWIAGRSKETQWELVVGRVWTLPQPEPQAPSAIYPQFYPRTPPPTETLQARLATVPQPEPQAPSFICGRSAEFPWQLQAKRVATVPEAEPQAPSALARTLVITPVSMPDAILIDRVKGLPQDFDTANYSAVFHKQPAASLPFFGKAEYFYGTHELAVLSQAGSSIFKIKTPPFFQQPQPDVVTANAPIALEQSFDVDNYSLVVGLTAEYPWEALQAWVFSAPQVDLDVNPSRFTPRFHQLEPDASIQRRVFSAPQWADEGSRQIYTTRFFPAVPPPINLQIGRVSTVPQTDVRPPEFDSHIAILAPPDAQRVPELTVRRVATVPQTELRPAELESQIWGTNQGALQWVYIPPPDNIIIARLYAPEQLDGVLYDQSIRSVVWVQIPAEGVPAAALDAGDWVPDDQWLRRVYRALIDEIIRIDETS